MKKARRQGFTLIELMIVVAIVAIIAAIAIPSLLNARKAGNEASAISSLRTIASVNQQYRLRFGAYASVFDDLINTGYVDGFVPNGAVREKSGYGFTYTASGQRWSCEGNPLVAGETGDRFFIVLEDGVIRFSFSGVATSASPPID